MEASRIQNIGGTTPSTATVATLGTARHMQGFDCITVIIDVPTNGSGGTLDLILESNWGDDSDWYNLFRVAQIANGGAAAIYKVTFALGNTVNAIGKNGTLTLAAGTPAAGHWGDKIRLRATAGAGVSAGIAVVCKVIGSKILR